MLYETGSAYIAIEQEIKIIGDYIALEQLRYDDSLRVNFTCDIEALLPANQFKRVHCSFIVSVAKIESYTAEAIEVNGAHIPIGRGYRDELEGL